MTPPTDDDRPDPESFRAFLFLICYARERWTGEKPGTAFPNAFAESDRITQEFYRRPAAGPGERP